MRDQYFMRYGIKSLAILCTVLLLSACDGLSEDTASGEPGTGSGGTVSNGSASSGSASSGTGSSGSGSSGSGSSGSGSNGSGSSGSGSSGSGSGSAPAVGSATVSWTPPTLRADNTTLTMAEISGYRVYYGTTTGSYPNSVDIPDRTVQQLTVNNIPTGTYFFVMTTVDMEGRESAFSSPAVQKQV